MKELVVIHDYLVSEEVVGDWDGNEEQATENINQLYHTLYDYAEEDIDPAELSELLELVWQHWIGQEALAELTLDDISDWCQHLLMNREQYLNDE
ncbi:MULTISPECIES: hypothetical protein [Thalassotalea]|uniref:hypothetical protein n=1 Tax=Thalassotalea TaxID=1518149 RepID=UPI000944C017|nr:MULTISPECIES: hypothetical protein [Thalassotalea]OKY25463.1 hypothetical protein BI291_16475 [Thalassotalea sp. PP2-459]